MQRSLADLMREERQVMDWPLRAADAEFLFERWVEANPAAMRALEGHARYIGLKGMPVSTKYLVEWLRYETPIKVAPIPFEDRMGNRHEFRVNNTHTPLLGRYLKRRNPELRVTMRRSMHDGEVAA